LTEASFDEAVAVAVRVAAWSAADDRCAEVASIVSAMRPRLASAVSIVPLKSVISAATRC
jgi:hypothetical protein